MAVVEEEEEEQEEEEKKRKRRRSKEGKREELAIMNLHLSKWQYGAGHLIGTETSGTQLFFPFFFFFQQLPFHRFLPIYLSSCFSSSSIAFQTLFSPGFTMQPQRRKDLAYLHLLSIPRGTKIFLKIKIIKSSKLKQFELFRIVDVNCPI